MSKKYEPTFKIKTREPTYTIEQVLEGLFWNKGTQLRKRSSPDAPQTEQDVLKEPLAKTAFRLLEFIKQKNGVLDRDFGAHAKQLNISQRVYYVVLSRLRNAGMIYKKDQYFYLSGEFSKRMGEYAGVWNAFTTRSQQ